MDPLLLIVGVLLASAGALKARMCRRERLRTGAPYADLAAAGLVLLAGVTGVLGPAGVWFAAAALVVMVLSTLRYVGALREHVARKRNSEAARLAAFLDTAHPSGPERAGPAAAPRSRPPAGLPSVTASRGSHPRPPGT